MRFISWTTCLPKAVRPLCVGFPCRGIGPVRVDHVSEGHVADAEAREIAKDAEIVVNHVAALNAHERGNFPVGMDAADIVCGASEGDVLRISDWQFAHYVNLIHRAFHGFRAGDCARNPDGKENRAQVAFAHARDVDQPSLWRTPKSNFGSRRRWVVSSWVSTTMELKWRS